MAKKLSTVTTDDIDGSPGAETVTFSVDGLDYEIDLGPAGRQRLHDGLQPFTSAGRRTRHHEQGRPPSSQKTADEVTRALQPHAITASCPLTCIEDLLPGKSFMALNRHLRQADLLVHPLVGDVAGLCQRTGLQGIRGLGAQGIELTTALLESAGLVPPRPDRTEQHSPGKLPTRLAL